MVTVIAIIIFGYLFVKIMDMPSAEVRKRAGVQCVTVSTCAVLSTILNGMAERLDFACPVKSYAENVWLWVFYLWSAAFGLLLYRKVIVPRIPDLVCTVLYSIGALAVALISPSYVTVALLISAASAVIGIFRARRETNLCENGRFS